MLDGVHQLVLGRGVVQHREMPDPHGRHVEKACRGPERQRRQRGARQGISPQGHREAVPEARRHTPEDERQWIAEQQERRGHHRQQQVLSHVGRKPGDREVIERRQQRARDGQEPESVRRRPPDGRRVSDSVEPTPPSRVGGSQNGQDEQEQGLERCLDHLPVHLNEQCRRATRRCQFRRRLRRGRRGRI